jgi:hypothetical protein
MIAESGNRFSVRSMRKPTIQTRARCNQESDAQVRGPMALLPFRHCSAMSAHGLAQKWPYAKISSKKFFMAIQDRWSACVL